MTQLVERENAVCYTYRCAHKCYKDLAKQKAATALALGKCKAATEDLAEQLASAVADPRGVPVCIPPPARLRSYSVNCCLTGWCLAIIADF